MSTLPPSASDLFAPFAGKSSETRIVELISEPGEASPLVADVQKLLSSTGLSSGVPAFPELTSILGDLEKNIELTRLMVGFGVDLTTLEFVAFDVTFNISAPLPFGKVVTLTAADLGVCVFPGSPTGGALTWNAMISADATFLGMNCTASLGLPEGEIELTGSSTAKPTATSLPGLRNAPDSLTTLLESTSIEGFHALVNPGATYAASVQIGGSLPWHGITLDSIGVDLVVDTVAGQESASLSAVAQVGDVGLAVALDWSTGDLVLSGQASFGAPPKLVDFVESLCKQLGIEPPPELPFDLDLTSLSVRAEEQGTGTSKSISFAAACTGVLVLDESGTSINVELMLEKASNSLDVTIRVGGLELTANKYGDVYCFVAEAASGSSPKLYFSELVRLLRLQALYGVPVDVSVGLQAAFFAAGPQPKGGGPRPRLFGVQFDVNATLDNGILDLVTGGSTVGITGATFLAASAAWSADDLSQLSQIPGWPGSFQLPQQVSKGPSFAGTLEVGGATVTAPLSPMGQQPPAAPAPSGPQAQASTPASTALAPAAVNSSSAARWFDVQKQVGPVYLDRAGFALGRAPGGGYEVDLQCDASFLLGPLTLSLNDFAVEFPLRWGFSGSDVRVSLQGMSLAYEKPPLSISGGFLHSGQDVYVGEAAIQTDALCLSAFGEYAKLSSGPSLSLFAALNDPPLGGPIFCFVTGLAAGFGYNSRLSVPGDAAGVATFPLIVAASPPPASGAPADPMEVIASCVTPTAGDDWLALGLLFRSFELVQSTALLTVAFGHDLSVAILAQAEISVPPNSQHPLAYAQVDILATYAPSTKTLEVFGVLAPSSFVFSTDCHLTGGFAYLLKESGDFVVTFGGYYPGYDYASHGYPSVPRIGLVWQVDDHTSIRGALYFALTSGAMMAGGSLDATWSSGIFSAWFSVGVDLFMQWKPFHYEGDFTMSLGVSFDWHFWFVHVHFTFHVGASLHAAGPPFHGTAHIDLDVVSFDVSFGPSASPPPLLTWPEFRALLPGDATSDAASSAVLSAKVTGGLVRDLSQSKSAGSVDWVVDGTHFGFELCSSIPVITARAGSDVLVTLAPAEVEIGILPMGIASADATLEVTITGPDGRLVPAAPAAPNATSAVVVEAVTLDFAAAHWGTHKPSSPDTAPKKVTGGFRIRGGRPTPDSTVTLPVSALLTDRVGVSAFVDRPASATPFSV